MKENRQ